MHSQPEPLQTQRSDHPSPADEIRELFAFNRWANARMLEAVAKLSDEQRLRPLGGSFPTLHHTLAHMAGAEWVWLSRWQGQSPAALPAEWNDVSFAELRRLWNEVERGQVRFLDDLTDRRLSDILSFRSFAGEQMQSKLWEVLRHVVNHASYHRGQVTMLIRQLGGEAASTDLIRFYRERGTRA